MQNSELVKVVNTLSTLNDLYPSKARDMEIVKGKDLKLLRVARGGDKVYKDECVYCFDSPVSDVCRVMV